LPPYAKTAAGLRSVLYLLDANVLIDADRDYYSIDNVPEFWAWLVHHAQKGNVKVCIENYEEVTEGQGKLPEWLKQDDVKKVLLLNEESDQAAVSHVVDNGYAPDLTDIEVDQIGRDPFLIAHALADVQNRCVVTTESSAPSKKRQNRRVPDVCNTFSVKWCNAFTFFKNLGFSTNWQPEE
jgi:hypothetical protein